MPQSLLPPLHLHPLQLLPPPLQLLRLPLPKPLQIRTAFWASAINNKREPSKSSSRSFPRSPSLFHSYPWVSLVKPRVAVYAQFVTVITLCLWLVFYTLGNGCMCGISRYTRGEFESDLYTGPSINWPFELSIQSLIPSDILHRIIRESVTCHNVGRGP